MRSGDSEFEAYRIRVVLGVSIVLIRFQALIFGDFYRNLIHRENQYSHTSFTRGAILVLTTKTRSKSAIEDRKVALDGSSTFLVFFPSVLKVLDSIFASLKPKMSQNASEIGSELPEKWSEKLLPVSHRVAFVLSMRIKQNLAILLSQCIASSENPL